MIHVLILDDDISVRRSLSAFLEDYGFAVTTAESGEDGLGKMRKKSYCAAVVDIRLPGMGGEEFIREAASVSPATRFVIHTGSREYTLSESLKRLGVRQKYVFYKPLDNLNLLLEGVRALTEEEA